MIENKKDDQKIEEYTESFIEMLFYFTHFSIYDFSLISQKKEKGKF